MQVVQNKFTISVFFWQKPPSGRTMGVIMEILREELNQIRDSLPGTAFFHLQDAEALDDMIH